MDALLREFHARDRCAPCAPCVGSMRADLQWALLGAGVRASHRHHAHERRPLRDVVAAARRGRKAQADDVAATEHARLLRGGAVEAEAAGVVGAARQGLGGQHLGRQRATTREGGRTLRRRTAPPTSGLRRPSQHSAGLRRRAPLGSNGSPLGCSGACVGLRRAPPGLGWGSAAERSAAGGSVGAPAALAPLNYAGLRVNGSYAPSKIRSRMGGSQDPTSGAPVKSGTQEIRELCPSPRMGRSQSWVRGNKHPQICGTLAATTAATAMPNGSAPVGAAITDGLAIATHGGLMAPGPCLRYAAASLHSTSWEIAMRAASRPGRRCRGGTSPTPGFLPPRPYGNAGNHSQEQCVVIDNIPTHHLGTLAMSHRKRLLMV